MSGMSGREAGWTTDFISPAGLRLRFARRGSGPPLLLITGIGAHLDMWSPLARLVNDRELIAFDPPGAGLSQRPRLPLRMGRLARIVEALLDELRLERVDVLGYSWGGGLAQELARRAPDVSVASCFARRARDLAEARHDRSRP
jgi:poly(3-hydroxyoctanoate) depolymerase